MNRTPSVRNHSDLSREESSIIFSRTLEVEWVGLRRVRRFVTWAIVTDRLHFTMFFEVEKANHIHRHDSSPKVSDPDSLGAGNHATSGFPRVIRIRTRLETGTLLQSQLQIIAKNRAPCCLEHERNPFTTGPILHVN